MNYPKLQLIAVIALLLSAPIVNSGSIYKCTKKDKGIIFTDKPCPEDSQAQVVYTETAEQMQQRLWAEKQETIKKLIAGSQTAAAKEYAQKNGLMEFYNKELANYSSEKTEKEAENAEQEKQQQLQLQQEALRLQRQQLAVEREKAQQNNTVVVQPPPYYGYGGYPIVPNNCRWPNKNCFTPVPPGRIPPFSNGGMNPPVAPGLPPMNPPTSGGLNPPITNTVRPTPPVIVRPYRP